MTPTDQTRRFRPERAKFLAALEQKTPNQLRLMVD